MYVVPLATGALAIHQLASNRRLDIPMTWQEKLSELMVRLRLVRPASDGSNAS
ncbi:hypothetical protein D3C77_801320 [compost metagenome]